MEGDNLQSTATSNNHGEKNEILIKVPENIATLLRVNDNHKITLNGNNNNTSAILIEDDEGILEEDQSLPKNSSKTKLSDKNKIIMKDSNERQMDKINIASAVDVISQLEEQQTQPIKRKKGRPRKTPIPIVINVNSATTTNTTAATSTTTITAPTCETNRINEINSNNDSSSAATTTTVSIIVDNNDGNENTLNFNNDEDIIYESIDDNACISVVEIVDDSQTSDNSLLLSENNINIDDGDDNKCNNDNLLLPKSTTDEIIVREKAGTSSPDILCVRTNSNARTYQNRKKSKFIEMNNYQLSSSNDLESMSIPSSSASSSSLSLQLLEQNEQNEQNDNSLNENLSLLLDDSNSCNNLSNECRRSQRKKVMKYDVRDLFKKGKRNLTISNTSINISNNKKINSITLSPSKAKLMLIAASTDDSVEQIDNKINSSFNSPQILKNFSSSLLWNNNSSTPSVSSSSSPPPSLGINDDSLIHQCSNKSNDDEDDVSNENIISNTIEMQKTQINCDDKTVSINNCLDNEISSHKIAKKVNEIFKKMKSNKKSTTESVSESGGKKRGRKKKCDKLNENINSLESSKLTPESLEQNISTDSKTKSLSSSIELSSNSVLEQKSGTYTSPNSLTKNESVTKSPHSDSVSENNSFILHSSLQTEIKPRGRGRPRKIKPGATIITLTRTATADTIATTTPQLSLEATTTTTSELKTITNLKQHDPSSSSGLTVINLSEDDSNQFDRIFSHEEDNQTIQAMDIVAEELKDIEDFIEKGESLLRGDYDVEDDKKSHKSQVEEKHSKTISNKLISSENDKKENSDDVKNITQIDILKNKNVPKETKTNVIDNSKIENKKLENVRKEKDISKKQEQLDEDFYDEIKNYVNGLIEDNKSPEKLIENLKHTKQEQSKQIKITDVKESNQLTQTKIQQNDDKKSKTESNIKNQKQKLNEDEEEEEILISFSSDIFSKAFNTGEKNFVIEEVKKVKKTKMNAEKKFNKIHKGHNAEESSGSNESNCTNTGKKPLRKGKKEKPHEIIINNFSMDKKKLQSKNKSLSKDDADDDDVSQKKSKEKHKINESNEKKNSFSLSRKSQDKIDDFIFPEEFRGYKKEKIDKKNLIEKQKSESPINSESKLKRRESTSSRKSKDSPILNEKIKEKSNESLLLLSSPSSSSSPSNHLTKDVSKRPKTPKEKFKNLFLEDIANKDVFDFRKTKVVPDEKTSIKKEEIDIKKDDEQKSEVSVNVGVKDLNVLKMDVKEKLIKEEETDLIETNSQTIKNKNDEKNEMIESVKINKENEISNELNITVSTKTERDQSDKIDFEINTSNNKSDGKNQDEIIKSITMINDDKKPTKDKTKDERKMKDKDDKMKLTKKEKVNKIDAKIKKQIKKLENAYMKQKQKNYINKEDGIKINEIQIDENLKNLNDFNKSMDKNYEISKLCSFQSKAALKDYSCLQNNISAVEIPNSPAFLKCDDPVVNDNKTDTATMLKNENSDDSNNSNNKKLINEEEKTSKDVFDETTNGNGTNSIRRSDRIKTISQARLQSTGIGLVKDKIKLFRDDDKIADFDDKYQPSPDLDAENTKFLKEIEGRLNRFVIIKENEYRCERVISKEAKRMTCDCFLTREEEERGELGCGEDCLNRLLMIECGPNCTVNDRCTNRRFQRNQNAPCKIFETEKKGFGLMADSVILPGQFIMEYVGEVLNTKQFEKRANIYSEDNNKHYYFMALRSDAIIDATQKGNISRFINHSCDPNAETQKWTVNGELRIGFFSTKLIMAGEEITFDYQFQRYGREAQKCFCESENCRGWIGEEPDSEEESEEDGEEGEEEESESEEETEKDQLAKAAKLKEDEKEGVKDITELGKVPREKDINEVEFADVKKTAKPSKVEKRRRKRIKKVKTKPDFGLVDAFADPDLEKDIKSLMRSGLKNQVHTLCLNRLMVRAKILDSRMRLLEILRKGEAPCKRLFLDYHGLRLLHGWMIETDTNDPQRDVEFRHMLVETLEMLPIPNKTMLKDSKVFQIVESWANEKSGGEVSNDSLKFENNSSSNTPDIKDSATAPIIVDNEKKLSSNEDVERMKISSLQEEIIKIAKKLIVAWGGLPEVFRIPKRERIEQMKEHEREADRQYKALNLTTEEDNERLQRKRNKERFGVIRKYRRLSRDSPERKSHHLHHHHHRHHHHRDSKSSSSSSVKDCDKISSHHHYDVNLSKEQRRQLFEAKVAKDEAEKRLGEERREFEIQCKFYGLDPNKVSPRDMPFSVNPATGQWYTKDRRPIKTPPSHSHIPVPQKPKSIDPKDYKLPTKDLPPLWKFAIDPKGRIYYYHIKIRIPQWEPPIKILPLDKDELQSGISTKDMDADLKQNVTEMTSTTVMQKVATGEISAMETDDKENDDSTESDNSTDSDDNETETKEKKTDMDPAEKRLSRRKKRYNMLVQERTISPRREEDRLYNQIELRKYRENKEKIRRRKEEIKRRKIELIKRQLEEGKNLSEIEVAFNCTTSTSTASSSSTKDNLSLPIQDYLISSDEDDKDDDCCVNNPLIDKFVKGDKIVDELDALNKEKPLKRPLPIIDKIEHKKRSKLEDKKLSEDVIRSVIYGSGQKSSLTPLLSTTTATLTSTTTIPDDVMTSAEAASLQSLKAAIKLKSNQSRKAKEKFRADIAGIIVHHLQPYRKNSCTIGRITNNEDFKHLARKLTHFVMVKELKHCDSTGQTLIVTESVKNKSREFIKKYMAKYGEIYIRPENDPEFKDIPH